MLIKDIIEQLYSIAKNYNVDINKNEIISFSPHADISSNIAFRLSKTLKKNPMDICDIIIEKLNYSHIKKIEKCKPGFINIWFKEESLSNEVLSIINTPNYGALNKNNISINLEFISANPTGPLVVVNARAGIIGMTLANILKYNGYNVIKEYYVNDGGNQIRKLGESILWHIINDNSIPFPENGYRGEYIKQLSDSIKKELKNPIWNEYNIKLCSDIAKKRILLWQQNTLKRYNIEFDNWVFESEIRNSDYIDKVLNLFDEKDLLYKKDGALFFKSSLFFDEKDRVLIKSDGEYSYLMPDIAYHYDKIKRGFNKIIDILGPDHHSHINRLKSAIFILNREVEFQVIIAQLINLFKNGKKFEMSKRRGDFITMDQLAEEVDVDVVKFIFLMRKLSQPIDFDIEEAKKHTLDNPVYYVQYAHARICSLFEKYNNTFEYVNIENIINQNEYIRKIIIKLLEYPFVLYGIANTFEIQKLSNYIYDLSGMFHKFYYDNRILTENRELTLMYLTLSSGVKSIIRNALNMMNIEAKQRMEWNEV